MMMLRQRAQRQKEKEAMKGRDAAAERMVKSGKDSSRLAGIGRLELPPPVAKGWMHKRGESMSAWKRRYFALIDPPEELGLGAAIYYFGAEKDLTRLLELGEQSQKGQLFLEHVKKVATATDDLDRTAIIQLVCEGRTWKIRPETPESFNYWREVLESYVAKEHRLMKERAKRAAAED